MCNNYNQLNIYSTHSSHIIPDKSNTKNARQQHTQKKEVKQQRLKLAYKFSKQPVDGNEMFFLSRGKKNI